MHAAAIVAAAGSGSRLGADLPKALVPLAGRPLVCTLHEVPMLRATRLLGRGVHHYTAVSDHVRDAWVAEGLPPERVTTVPNAVSGVTYALAGDAERDAARRDKVEARANHRGRARSRRKART